MNKTTTNTLMDSPSVYIIIVQYNNSSDTIACLESVKELDYQNLSVIIIDNASEVKHLNAVRFFVESAGDKRFTLLKSRQNLGYAGGNNMGIRRALKNGARHILILNPDTTVKPRLLDMMLATVKLQKNIGVAGVNIDEGARTVNAGIVSWLKPTLVHTRQEVGHILEDNLYVPGSVMLIGKEVFDEIGFLDDRYFLYFEDADFCMRAKKAGFGFAVAQDKLASHAVSQSTGSLGAPLLLRYHYRNAHLFNWKNGPFYIRLTLPFWSIYVMVKQLLKVVFRPDKRAISLAILRGVADFYKGRFGKI